MKKIFLAALCLASASQALAAPCAGYSADARQTSADTYDPSSITQVVLNLVVQAQDRDLPNGCTSAPVSLRARSGTIALRNGATTLLATASRSNLTGRITPSEVDLNGNARGDIVRDGMVQLAFLDIAAGQFVPPGNYVADLDLIVGDATPRPIQLIVRVMPSMRFEGSGGGALSLGELSDGGEARSTFFYRTNASLAVTARSDHGGRLQHSEGAALGAIPYAAYISGRRLSLETPDNFTIEHRSTALQSEEVLIQVEPQRQRFAGVYRDTLTLDFTAF